MISELKFQIYLFSNLSDKSIPYLSFMSSYLWDTDIFLLVYKLLKP